MTPIEDRFYFRLESGSPIRLTYCVIYYRREHKRWWQREYVQFAEAVYWGEPEDGTPEQYASTLLAVTIADNKRRAEAAALVAAYKDLRQVKS